ncbi:glycosyltransferase [Candidatus Micrarchaeota archaeon]|nr:glycosyltransferase [Candidatus Micrarchaeota archaeon]
MKIAFFTDTYLPQTNGVVSYLVDLIKLLSKDHQIVLFAPSGGSFKVEQLSENFKIYWIHSIPFPFYSGYRISSINYKKVSDLLKKENPDLVHSHAPVLLALQGVIAAKQHNLPCIITYHTHFPDYVPHLLNRKLPSFLKELSNYTVKKLIKHAFTMADIVTAPTQKLVDELNSYGLKNALLLLNGIEFSKFDCTADQIRAFRRKYNPKNKKTIVYVGRISFEKRIDQLIHAFSLVEAPDRILLIVGGGPYVSEFRKLAHALGIKNIVFTGFVPSSELGAAYRSADVFVSASDSETFGLTFVEAMHCRIPVIAARKLGPIEVIEHGKTGLLIRPGDIPRFAKAMEKLLEDDDLRSKMGKEGQRSSEKYSIEKSADMTVRLYVDLLRKRGKVEK